MVTVKNIVLNGYHLLYRKFIKIKIFVVNNVIIYINVNITCRYIQNMCINEYCMI